MDNSEEFVYRRDGEEAEVVVYAPDACSAERGFELSSAAASLPGAESPVFAVSAEHYGHVVVSGERVAPSLASAPVSGALLSTETSVGALARSLGVEGGAIPGELNRRLREARFNLPRTGVRGVRSACEYGAEAAAGMGVVEEDDLGLLAPLLADPDSVGRRGLAAGERDADFFDRPAEMSFHAVGEVFDRDGVESVGLDEGSVVVLVRAGALDLGRLAFELHRERARDRVMRRVYDPVGERDRNGLHAFPRDSEETEDFLLASGAVSNFADWRACFGLHVVRRVLRDVLGEVAVTSAWRVGGAVRGKEEVVTHRSDLAAGGEGRVIACVGESGSDLCTGIGTMYKSVPPFAVRRCEQADRFPMEEAGLLGTLARLEVPGAVSRGEV